MIQIQRYEIKQHKPTGHFGIVTIPYACPTKDGSLVAYADYAKLQADNKALLEALKRTLGILEELDGGKHPDYTQYDTVRELARAAIKHSEPQ